MSTYKTEVPYGVLDLVILQTLAAMGPMHGYSIARRIEQVADNLLTMSQGSIYPALIRLEQKGWIETAVGRLRDQAPGQDLLADDGGRAAAAGRSGELGACDRAGRPVPRGEIMIHAHSPADWRWSGPAVSSASSKAKWSRTSSSPSATASRPACRRKRRGARRAAVSGASNR